MGGNFDFDKLPERRGTGCLKYDSAKRRGKPEGVLPLWVADMDFEGCPGIIEAIKERAEHGIFGYTETGERYFAAVSGWLGERHGMEIEESWIVKTPGVVFALATAVRAYTSPGDPVLIQQPVYYPFSQVIRDNGRKILSSDLVLSPDGKYRIDFSDFERKIKENHVKLFILCSPHNPVGRVWEAEELRELAEICLRHGVVVVSDEIHADFTFRGHVHTPLINADGRIRDLAVTCTSPAKTFNLAGLQISNIIIENETLRREFKRQIAAAGYSQANAMGIVACEAAYEKGGEWYAALLAYLQENLEFVRGYLAREIPEVRLIEPEGTYLLWLDFRALGLGEIELEDLIVNKAGLWLDRGSLFGDAGKGFERINIATGRAVLAEALGRLKAAVRGAA